MSTVDPGSTTVDEKQRARKRVASVDDDDGSDGTSNESDGFQGANVACPLIGGRTVDSRISYSVP